jgi:hypothetical protein
MERELPDSEQRECSGEGPRGNCRGRICTFFNNGKSVSPENEVSRGAISRYTPSSRRNYSSFRRSKNLPGLGMDRESRRAYGVAKS